ncbi:MAG: hypothetical protein HOV81_09180 [Kofleriaceae bacterium]|nr:hypothetical protein [Kofleriaceae bacterium]
MRLAVVSLAVAACATKPPPSRNPGAAYAVSPGPSGPPASSRPIVGWTVPPPPPPPPPKGPVVTRPAIDFSIYTPDVHDLVRWPLSAIEHPSLAPRFAIAAALAQPGVGLAKLCSLGAQNRHGIDLDLAAYLRGWCSALAGDGDAACEHLAPLLGSATPAIATAVKVDLANILADHGRADDAEHWLNRHHIHSVELLDRLSAAYVEVGTNDDALAISRIARASDDHATLATRCTRLGREIALGGDPDGSRLEELAALAGPIDKASIFGDSTCTRLHYTLACWTGHSCTAFLALHNATDDKLERLREAYDLWPSARSFEDWRAIANRAKYAIPSDGAAALALAAFENEIATDDVCSDNEKEWLRRSERMLRSEVARTPTLAPQLERLEAQCR